MSVFENSSVEAAFMLEDSILGTVVFHSLNFTKLTSWITRYVICFQPSFQIIAATHVWVYGTVCQKQLEHQFFYPTSSLNLHPDIEGVQLIQTSCKFLSSESYSSKDICIHHLHSFVHETSFHFITLSIPDIKEKLR